MPDVNNLVTPGNNYNLIAILRVTSRGMVTIAERLRREVMVVVGDAVIRSPIVIDKHARVMGGAKGFLLVPPARFQRATFRLGGGRSMQLSYGSEN